MFDYPPVTPFAIDQDMDPRLGSESRSPQILKIDRVEVCSALPGVVEVLDESDSTLDIFEAADAEARPGVDNEGTLEGPRPSVRGCLYHHFKPHLEKQSRSGRLEARFARPARTTSTPVTLLALACRPSTPSPA
jgi:hypothetical protein